jgi:uncharacterized protein with NRDE domain
MCTVTFIPIKEGFVLTSSRDEKTLRATIKAQTYSEQNNILVYPRDVAAGGTWIAASNKKQIACLLNGAFKNHTKQAVYAKSRGHVLLDSFKFSTHSEFMSDVDLNNVEPFTLLLIDHENDLEFNQLVWDGEKKHIQKIDHGVARIWSSATLYSDPDRELRKNWFKSWLIENNENEDSNIFNFHSSKHSNVSRVNILMERENGLQTVSISQVRVIKENESFIYHDLADQSLTFINLSDLKCIQVLQ